MKTLATIVTMFLFASIVSAQTQAAMTAKFHEVKQGEIISFSVKVEPAPNVHGTVRVIAKSANGTAAIVADGGLQEGKTSADTEATIPLDGPIGTWTVTEVQFIPYASPAKKLGAMNLPSFEVTARKTIEPDSAVVEVK
jgi:hypothetical protein